MMFHKVGSASIAVENILVMIHNDPQRNCLIEFSNLIFKIFNLQIDTVFSTALDCVVNGNYQLLFSSVPLYYCLILNIMMFCNYKSFYIGFNEGCINSILRFDNK